jgi:hypothetical protein
LGATATHLFFPEDTANIFSYTNNQLSLYTDYYSDGFMANVTFDNYFGDNQLMYLSGSVSYSIALAEDWKIMPMVGSAISYNKVLKGKSSTLSKKQKLELSNVYAGTVLSYDLGKGFTAAVSARVMYSREATSNQKSTQFSAMCGVSYDLDF